MTSSWDKFKTEQRSRSAHSGLDQSRFESNSVGGAWPMAQGGSDYLNQSTELRNPSAPSSIRIGLWYRDSTLPGSIVDVRVTDLIFSKPPDTLMQHLCSLPARGSAGSARCRAAAGQDVLSTANANCLYALDDLVLLGWWRSEVT